MTFEQFTERVYKGLKADLTKGKPHWDELSKEEQGKYLTGLNNIVVHDSMLINGEFPIIFPQEWEHSFSCYGCKTLTSLEGAPKIVYEDFDCSDCVSLESLEGAPETVQANFYCSSCDKLKNLEGAPKEVGWYFSCSDCKSLTSLKGAIEKIDGSFYCSNCISLESLEGAPKEVGEDFDCAKCKGKFMEDDVREVSKVKGEIIV